MHYTNPERAFALARALGVLPDRFVLVGVQPEDAETLEQRLSEPVARAVEVAAAEIVSLIGQYARDG
jgi:hydrogenase maturation protease